MDKSQTEAYLNNMHKVWDFINSLNKEQLTTLNSMLTLMALDKDNFVINYIQGFLSGKLSYQFDLCPSCMVKHEPGDFSHVNSIIGSNIPQTKGATPAGYV